MKIFITGAAGFIGSHLVTRLVREGFELIAHDNLYRGKTESLQKHITLGKIDFWEGDIRSYDQVRRLMEECETVFHLAAQSNVIGAEENMDYSFETNVIGSYNVLKAAMANGVKRLIFISSREVYGEAERLPVTENHPLKAKNTYGVSKIAGEKYVSLFGKSGEMETVILRLANVYGPGDRDRVIPIFINNLLHNEPIRIFGGKQLIDFVSVEIVVEALVQSMKTDKAINNPVNIGSGKGTNLYDLAERIMELFGKKSEIITLPGRNAEVEKYTADITEMKKIFDINIPDDPLYYLEKLM